LSRLEERAQFVRLETVRLVAIAKSGHYSSTFSCAEILSALYYGGELRIDPARPDWADRDRFVMSKGHAAVGLYPVLADLGFFPPSELDDYTRLGSVFADHPDVRHIPGVDFSSGSLGHGLSVAAGMALAAKLDGGDHRAICLLGDAELNEGQIWEAAMAAAHFKLGNLVAIVDRNGMGLDGFTEEVMSIEPHHAKWEAFGWRVVHVDGHDVNAVAAAFADLPDRRSATPTVIVADTVKGKGVPWMEFSRVWHLGAVVGDDYAELERVLREQPVRATSEATR